MRRLFDELDNWTEEAGELAIRIRAALRPIISEALKSGASIRDVELVAMNDMAMLCAELNIRAGLERRRLAREAK